MRAVAAVAILTSAKKLLKNHTILPNNTTHSNTATTATLKRGKNTGFKVGKAKLSVSKTITKSFVLQFMALFGCGC